MPHHVVSFPAGQSLPVAAVDGQVLAIGGELWAYTGGKWARTGGSGGGGAGTSYGGQLRPGGVYPEGSLATFEGELIVAVAPMGVGEPVQLGRWETVGSKMKPRGAYSVDDAYSPGDLVQRGAALYRARAHVAPGVHAPGEGSGYDVEIASHRSLAHGDTALTGLQSVALRFQNWSAITGIEGLVVQPALDSDPTWVSTAWTGRFLKIIADSDWAQGIADDTPVDDIPALATGTVRADAKPEDSPLLRYVDFDVIVSLEDATHYVIYTNAPIQLVASSQTESGGLGEVQTLVWGLSGNHPTEEVPTVVPTYLGLTTTRPVWETVFDASLSTIITGQVLAPGETVADIDTSLPLNSVVFQA